VPAVAPTLKSVERELDSTLGTAMSPLYIEVEAAEPL